MSGQSGEPNASIPQRLSLGRRIIFLPNRGGLECRWQGGIDLGLSHPHTSRENSRSIKWWYIGGQLSSGKRRESTHVAIG